jgi:tetratricopeptide (TPR) repeat protein
MLAAAAGERHKTGATMIAKRAFAAALVIVLAAGQALAGGRDDFERAKAAARAGDHTLAIALYTRAVEAGDLTERGRAVSYFNRGNARAANGEIDLAIADYGRSISVAPDFALYRRTGRLSDALADLTTALGHAPRSARALTNRGNVRLDMFRFTAAMADYQAALSANPGSKAAQENLARAGRARETYREAMTPFDEAVATAPQEYFGYLERGIVRMNLGDYFGAVEDMEKAHRLNPTDAYTVLWLFSARSGARMDAQAGLKAERSRINEVQWPGPIIGMIAGERELESVEPLIHNGTKEERAQRECVLFYFRGKQLLAEGAVKGAIASFRRAIDSGAKTFLQYPAAEAELARLGL